MRKALPVDSMTSEIFICWKRKEGFQQGSWLFNKNISRRRGERKHNKVESRNEPVTRSSALNNALITRSADMLAYGLSEHCCCHVLLIERERRGRRGRLQRKYLCLSFPSPPLIKTWIPSFTEPANMGLPQNTFQDAFGMCRNTVFET